MPHGPTRGEPFRSIASLELLGSLIGVMLLLDDDHEEGVSHSARISLGGLTDNMGNRVAVARLLTTKWPLAAFVAALATQLEDKSILLQLAWVPRDQNADADAITNGVTDWLSPKNRVSCDMASLPFKVLHDLLEKGKDFYRDSELVNIESVEAEKHSTILLKVSDPWDGRAY